MDTELQYNKTLLILGRNSSLLFYFHIQPDEGSVGTQAKGKRYSCSSGENISSPTLLKLIAQIALALFYSISILYCAFFYCSYGLFPPER